ncbi:hypothetical protein HK096_005321, partial [Nowakowskiella sp. JEL0078]
FLVDYNLLPWFDGVNPLRTSYAGYMSAPHRYTFFPAQNPEIDNPPLIIWLQGGPGTSSSIGIFHGMGPFRLLVVNNRTVITRNEHTWNQKYGNLFIDNPIGTGYSFVDSYTNSESFKCDNLEDDPSYQNGYVTNQAAVARDLLHFLKEFYNYFPSELKCKLYITGESYAGKYIPAISSLIQAHNNTETPFIPLSGIALGNSLTDPFSQILAHSIQAEALGILDEAQNKSLSKIAQKARKAILENDWSNATQQRAELFRKFKKWSGIDTFDLRKEDTGVPGEWHLISDLLNQDVVQAALHVSEYSEEVVTKRVYSPRRQPQVYKYLLEDVMKSQKQAMETLLNSGLRVLLFQGQYDFRDGVLGCDYWINSLEWAGKIGYLDAKRELWKKDTTSLMGYVKAFKNLKRVVVLGAGHFVTSDQPIASLLMINDWIEM